jgi:membrane peptidoglycan carboxypeptidase
MTPEGFARCLRAIFHMQTDLHPESYGVELGLGLAEIPMPEIATAYSILANGGTYLPPTAILRIQDREGHNRKRDPRPAPKQMLRCETVVWVTQALLGVSRSLSLPDGVVSKTGSTSATSYVAGYTSDIAFTAWMGRGVPGRGPTAVDVPPPGGRRPLAVRSGAPPGSGPDPPIPSRTPQRAPVAFYVLMAGTRRSITGHWGMGR